MFGIHAQSDRFHETAALVLHLESKLYNQQEFNGLLVDLLM